MITVDSAAGPFVYGVRLLPNWASAVLRWNGFDWDFIGHADLPVIVMASFDSGTGPQLHVGGTFTSIDGIPANRIARWTGATWEPLGSGISSTASPRLMITHNDGSGPALYVADVRDAGGMPVDRIAKWDGHAWSNIGGGGLSSSGIVTLHVLGSFDDGTGPALFAGGYMTTTGTGIPLRSIARYKNGVWDDMLGGVRGGIPRSMAVFDDGRGPSLFVGGEFNTVGSGAPNTAFGIAQWVGCQNQCYADCDNSTTAPRLNIEDFTCFINKFAAGDPYADCNQDGQRNIDDIICFINKWAEQCRP